MIAEGYMGARERERERAEIRLYLVHSRHHPATRNRQTDRQCV